MKYDSKAYTFIKGGIFLIGFIILHYLYDWFPNIITMIFSGIDESSFEHYKIGFYVYLFIVLIEVAIFKNQFESRSDHIYASLFTTSILPWITFMIWYSVSGVTGELPFVVEIVWANIATYTTLLIAHRLNLSIYKKGVSKEFRVITIIMFVLMIYLFTLFTFQKPWTDLFTPAY